MKILLGLFGWYGFWRDSSTGKWYGYDPRHAREYSAYENDRVPLPSFMDFIRWLRHE